MTHSLLKPRVDTGATRLGQETAAFHPTYEQVVNP